MVITTPPQNPTIEKLLTLAGGNRELVHAAIKAEVDARTGSADLARVVKRIGELIAAGRRAA